MNFDFLKPKNQVRIDWPDWKGTIADRLEFSSQLQMKHLSELPSNKGTCVIVGGAPSVKDHLPEIRAFSGNDNCIATINHMHEFLIKNSIVPTIHVLFENDLVSAEQALGGHPNLNVNYFICSCLTKQIFFELADYHSMLWHYYSESPEYQRLIGKYFPGEFMVGGEYATFFRTLHIALTLGYRKFELFGCDSSFEGNSDHVKGYLNEIPDESQKTVLVKHPKTEKLHEFKTSDRLIFQVYEFMKFCVSNQPFIRLRVHGESLLRYVHERLYPEQYEKV